MRIIISENQRLITGLAVLLALILSAFEGLSQNINSLDQSMSAQTWASSTMETMSLDEKIGQLFMVAAYSNRDSTHATEIEELVEKYHIGGTHLLSGSPVKQSQLLNAYREKQKSHFGWRWMQNGEWA